VLIAFACLLGRRVATLLKVEYPRQSIEQWRSKEMRTGMEFGATIDKAPASPTISTVVDVKVDSSVISRFTPAPPLPPPSRVAAAPQAGQNAAATAAAEAAVAAPIMPAAALTIKKATKQPKKRKSVKYCKAPGAPKRFKSAFIFFTMARHREIRKKIEEKEGKGDRTPDVAKIISEEWRNMKPEDRAVWDEKARLDKERYEVEKSMYTGPWKIPAKMKSVKDPRAPKRPMSSFLSYSNSKRAEIKRQIPGISNAEASKLLAKMWREAPDEEKREHIEREERLREVYKVEIAQWRDRAKKEQEDVREKREEAALRYIDNRAKGIVDESDLMGVPWGENYNCHGTYEDGPDPGPGPGPAYGNPHYLQPPPYHAHPPPPPSGYSFAPHDMHRQGPPPPPPLGQHPGPHHGPPIPYGPPPPPYHYSNHAPPPPQYHYGNGRDAPPGPPPPGPLSGHYGHYDDGYGYGPPPPGPYHHHGAPAPEPGQAPVPAQGHDGRYSNEEENKDENERPYQRPHQEQQNQQPPREQQQQHPQHHSEYHQEHQQQHQEGGKPSEDGYGGGGDSRGFYFDANGPSHAPPPLDNCYGGGYSEHYPQQPPHDAPPKY